MQAVKLFFEEGRTTIVVENPTNQINKQLKSLFNEQVVEVATLLKPAEESAPKPEPKSEPAPESKPEPKPEPKSEPKSESETKADKFDEPNISDERKKLAETLVDVALICGEDGKKAYNWATSEKVKEEKIIKQINILLDKKFIAIAEENSKDTKKLEGWLKKTSYDKKYGSLKKQLNK